MTSEFVTIGHPDKMADYISEYILDRYLESDPNARYALECQIKDNHVTLGGEITSTKSFSDDDYRRFVREAVCEVGYTPEYRDSWPAGSVIDPDRLDVDIHVSKQSPDIAVGVDRSGWGDQGIFFGMAVNDPLHDYMPLDYWTAKKLGNEIYDRRIGGLDIKTQVTVRRGSVTDIVVAVPTMDSRDFIFNAVRDIAQTVVGHNDFNLTVNGTGTYIRHSSMGDCGTTGRKLVVDFYGGNCRIGGGSPWTKDPTKADLTLNIYARKLALEKVKTGLHECHVAIDCCIGRRELNVDFFDSSMNWIGGHVERRPASEIIECLGLNKPVYADKCRYGIFV